MASRPVQACPAVDIAAIAQQASHLTSTTGVRDRSGAASERVIYPLALGYYEDREVVVGWCTLRTDYRRFRIDGVTGLAVLDANLPEPRRSLFHRWRTANRLPDLT